MSKSAWSRKLNWNWHPRRPPVRARSGCAGRAVGEAAGEVLCPALVDLKFDVHVHVVWLDRAAGERAEDVQLGHQAERPAGPAVVKCQPDMLGRGLQVVGDNRTFIR